MKNLPSVMIRLAEKTDLEFVVRTERIEGYEELTARWTIEEHEIAYSRPDTRYLVGQNVSGAAIGFIILQPFDDPHEGTKIKRIVVENPGQGIGRALLEAAFTWIYQRTQSPRIWLDVFVHNTRAVAAYRAAGMSLDGVLRAAYRLPDGRRVDRHVMSLLREEWQGG